MSQATVGYTVLVEQQAVPNGITLLPQYVVVGDVQGNKKTEVRHLCICNGSGSIAPIYLHDAFGGTPLITNYKLAGAQLPIGETWEIDYDEGSWILSAGTALWIYTTVTGVTWKMSGKEYQA